MRTTALRDGLTVKGDASSPGFGYLNEVHAHAWDFVDQPLVVPGHVRRPVRQNGVQVKWLAPTDLFLELGAETGNGDGYPCDAAGGQRLNGATLFAQRGRSRRQHELARRRSVAHAASRRSCGRPRTFPVRPLFDSFTGDSETWVVDGVFKWGRRRAAN